MTTTPRQRDVLRTIRDYRTRRGYSPAISDLCRELGIASKNGVNDHLRALERKGLLVRAPKVARSMRPTSAGLAVIR